MKRQNAFTLIELMIVVAIISVIAAVAIPTYDGQVKKGRRSDAQQLMLDASSKQEQFILDRRQYSTSFTQLGISKDGWTCTTTCSNNFYNVVITADNTATPPTWTVTATAQGTQADDGDLVLNSDGTRTHDGDSGW